MSAQVDIGAGPVPIGVLPESIEAQGSPVIFHTFPYHQVTAIDPRGYETTGLDQ